MKAIQSKTIVFVTGAFVTNLGWEQWQRYFESKGYKTYAPAWPHKEGTAKEVRDRQPNDVPLARVTLKGVVNHYAAFIETLPEKPIIIGHSLGGLITQLLVSRGLAAAAVALQSVPPLGVIPYEFSFLKAGWRSLGLFTSSDKTYLMSFKTWQYAFTNGMSLEDQKAAYEANTIPESKRAARGALTFTAKIDFSKPHAPLLFVAGGKDNILPASLNKRNFQRYTNKSSVTDWKEFPENNHFVVGLPNYETTAGYIYNWIQQL
ncbi:alpha/beta hydrolase [Lacibacter sediminis]|uniref:Alpha/beta hydrolase n=1 Tax=Lacibacter sediminis TaxID=2760713 RepID=A0A7G5XCD2_9BACT|nr:alpha/beta hydrolase [Lacibacter sediminis]QNA43135.1 alpha/beta hydrolase [Lacibacter sediminis]